MGDEVIARRRAKTSGAVKPVPAKAGEASVASQTVTPGTTGSTGRVTVRHRSGSTSWGWATKTLAPLSEAKLNRRHWFGQGAPERGGSGR